MIRTETAGTPPDSLPRGMVGLNAGAPDLETHPVLAELDLIPGERSSRAERDLEERLKVGRKGMLPLAVALDVYAEVLVTGKPYLPFRFGRTKDRSFEQWDKYTLRAAGVDLRFARQLPERSIDAIDFGDSASCEGCELTRFRSFRVLAERIARSTLCFRGESPHRFRVDTLSHQLMNYQDANWGDIWIQRGQKSLYTSCDVDTVFVNSDLGASIVLAMRQRWTSGEDEDT